MLGFVVAIIDAAGVFVVAHESRVASRSWIVVERQRVGYGL